MLKADTGSCSAAQVMRPARGLTHPRDRLLQFVEPRLVPARHCTASRLIPMEYEGTYHSGYEKGSYCKLTGCTGGYMCAQGGSLLTKFDSDNIDVRDDNYKICQPEITNHFDGGVRCTGAVNLPADTKDKCVKLVKPSTHGWWCCQYWDGEYHV